MKAQTPHRYYDAKLQIGAYYFKGQKRGFTNHFHAYYVIGVIEQGQCKLSCRNQEYYLQKNTMFVFNPGDNHGCMPLGDLPLEYRTINISKAVMLQLVDEITGLAELPGFVCPALEDGELADGLRSLHQMLVDVSAEFEKEEALLFWLSELLQRYSKPFNDCVPDCRAEVECACQFLQQHYTETISLEQICQWSGLSKSTLLRAFTKAKGITPYRYLQTLRIGEAQKLLQRGCLPVEAALQTGFSDQSHFTNYFHQMIGLTPGAYREMFQMSQSVKREEF